MLHFSDLGQHMYFRSSPIAHSNLTPHGTDWKARLLACILGITIVPMATFTMATKASFCQCPFHLC